MSYRPVLTGRALGQFNDFIKDHEEAYEAFMRRLLWLIDAPWDAWLVYPGVQQRRPSLADDLIKGILKLLDKGLGEESGNHGRKQDRLGADGEASRSSCVGTGK